jgi:methionine-gamma-lyase
MFDTFEGMEGCYLYSRHSSPSNLYLDRAMAAMELNCKRIRFRNGAITYCHAALCGWNHIVSSRTIYGTYAFQNFTRFDIKTTFVDITTRCG